MMKRKQSESHDHPKRTAIYYIARTTLIITWWIWTTIIIAFLIQFLPVLLLQEPPGTSFWNKHVIPLFQHNFFVLATTIVAISLLVIITFAAWLLKVTLQQYAHPEGFDRIVNAVEQDTISPQLDSLKTQLQQQHQQHLNEQRILINGMYHTYDLLINNYKAANLKELHVLFQRELSLQEHLSQILQDIQQLLKATSTGQLEQLRDLNERSRKTEKIISTDLQIIYSQLQHVQDKLDTTTLPEQNESAKQTSMNIPVISPKIQQQQDRQAQADSSSTSIQP